MSTNLSLLRNSSSVVYVRLVNKKDQLEWYTFSDFNRSRGLKGYGDYLPEPTPLKGKKISQFSRCVAVGSTIYCIGGRRLSSPGRLVVDNSVFCLDTSRHEREQLWVQAPSMLCPRSEHHAIVVNGPFRVQPVLVGSTLFWFNKSELHAYDTIRKWHCSGRIKGLVGEIVPVDWLQDHSNVKPVLLHLAGDEFCWIHYEQTTYYLTLLHCIHFRLSTLTESHLTAVAESCQSYMINTPSRLLDAVLI